MRAGIHHSGQPQSAGKQIAGLAMSLAALSLLSSILLALTLPQAAFADEIQSSGHRTAGELYLRGSFGYALQDLVDINSQIENAEHLEEIREYQGDYLPEDYYGSKLFGDSKVMDLEFGYLLTPSWSLGCAVAYRACQVDNFLQSVYFTSGDELFLKTVSISAIATYRFPFAPAFSAGGELGVAYGSYKRDISTQYQLVPTLNTTFYGDYKGDGLTFGLFAGYERRISDRIRIQTRAGYRHLDLGEYTGTTDRVGYGRYSGTLVDAQGEPVEVDLSGFFFSAGLDFSFLLPEYMR